MTAASFDFRRHGIRTEPFADIRRRWWRRRGAVEVAVGTGDPHPVRETGSERTTLDYRFTGPGLST